MVNIKKIVLDSSTSFLFYKNKELIRIVIFIKETKKFFSYDFIKETQKNINITKNFFSSIKAYEKLINFNN